LTHKVWAGSFRPSPKDPSFLFKVGRQIQSNEGLDHITKGNGLWTSGITVPHWFRYAIACARNEGKKMKIPLATICVISSLLFSCGYALQSRTNPLRSYGVETVFVEQFTNSTFRPGLEQLFSTAMIREIQKSRSFRIVGRREMADSILSGAVTSAESGISSTKSVELSPGKRSDVASEYSASVAVSISLRDRHGRVLFSQAVSSSKIYPGVAVLGEGSATVPLTNESEQRLAIQFLASQMMASVYQRMVDTF
jgi:hypothetical protein